MEKGEGVGLARDIYTRFWLELSDGYFIGESSRVPFVRHDMFEEDWSVIGKILVKAFFDLRYFPTILAVAFIQYCFLGK